MKKMLAYLTILVIMTTLSLPIVLAQQTTAIGLPNPVFEATAEEAAKASDTFGANLPEGATDISYSYIKGQEGPAVFQVNFTWEEAKCNIRVFKGTQIEDLSGMHYSWLKDEEVMIGDYKGRLMYNEGEIGVAIWYDEENELVYNISMTGHVTPEKLKELALINVEQALIDLPNPIFDATAEEAAKVSGTPGAKLPEEAKDISYSYIKGQEGPVVFQVKFTLEDAECTIRIFKGEQAEDLSGMHYSWSNEEEVMIGLFPGRLLYNKGELGVAIWHDEHNELVYNASMVGNVTHEKLMKLALVNAE